MVLDDPLADGEAQARSVDLTEGRKCLEQLPVHFRRDPRPGILDLGDDFLGRCLESQHDLASAGHRFCRIMDDVMEYAAQTFRVDYQALRGRWILEFNSNRTQ